MSLIELIIIANMYVFLDNLDETVGENVARHATSVWWRRKMRKKGSYWICDIWEKMMIDKETNTVDILLGFVILT